MNHLHTYLYLENNGFLEVSLDSPGNVYLMTDAAYKNYLASQEFEYYGGAVKTGKKMIKAPKEGKWHLVIDNSNTNESLNVALQITNGRQIYEDSEPVEERDTIIEKKNRKIAPEGEKNRKNVKDYRKHFQKEIIKLLKNIDEDDLKFLIEQATILVQNQKIHELNKEIEHYNEKISHKKKKPGKTKKAKTHTKEGVLIDIEQQSDNVFILVINGVRKVLSRMELRSIVTMCHSPLNDTDFSRQLYEWLNTRRNDILFDVKIRSAQHPLWPLLRRFLRNKFKAKR
jgi:hypothetical protein